MDIKTATPAQIDGEIARLNGIMSAAQARMERAGDTIARIAALPAEERDLPWNSQAKYDEAVADKEAARIAYVEALNNARPLTEEFTARGGWTRFYLVTNAGGHIHHTTGCATCFPTTEFAWLTDYSGMEHATLVGEAGEMACTACFPDAPVDTLRRASRIRYEAPEAKARREERERKAAERKAAEVVVEAFSEYGSRPRRKTFKTVRSVTNQIASHLGSLCWYGPGHPDGASWIANVESMRAALVAKGVDYDYDKALAAARKKVVREGAQPKF